jgi:hypothetical protein
MCGDAVCFVAFIGSSVIVLKRMVKTAEACRKIATWRETGFKGARAVRAHIFKGKAQFGLIF